MTTTSIQTNQQTISSSLPVRSGFCQIVDKIKAILSWFVDCVKAAFDRLCRSLPWVSQPTVVENTVVENKVLAFLDGGRDEKGRTYEDLLALPDNRLEKESDSMAQLFPTRERDPHHPNSNAWVVANHEMAADIASSIPRTDRLLRGLMRIKSLCGLNGPERFNERSQAYWIQPGGHDPRRFTRILKSLRIAALNKEAQLLSGCLDGLLKHPSFANLKKTIGESVIAEWADAEDEPMGEIRKIKAPGLFDGQRRRTFPNGTIPELLHRY